MPIFSVEGGIGAGKTTFLAELEEAGYRVLCEPVDKWTSDMMDGKSMFELFYEDKNKYGFAFQMYVLQSRIQYIIDTVASFPDDIIIIERCPLTDCKVFAEMMHEEGIINDYDFRVYKKWQEFCMALIPPMAGIVYLRVSPEICVQRIMKRGRSGEQHIDLNYIKLLHKKHEEWLMNLVPTDPSVLVIDGDGPVPSAREFADFIETMPLLAGSGASSSSE